jgi:uncharacterized RDD family membrane protein YckC
MSIERVYSRFPKVPIKRRVAAFAIDFVVIWLCSCLVGNNLLLQILVYTFLWFGLRVVLVSNNQGQSLGRWALDMKVLDARFSKIPGLLTLGKRESILGLSTFLALIGLSWTFANPISFLLLITPLAVDCGLAFADQETQQAFHDRIGQTIVIQTRRGYSLDIRLKKIIAQIRRSMK